MQPREKVLAAVAGLLLLVAGGYLGWGYVDEMFRFREQQSLALEKQIMEQKQIMLAGRKAQRKLTFWKEQSLPTDVQLANTLYQQWLGDSVKNAGLKEYKINPGQIVRQRTPNGEEVLYHKLPFNIRVQGDLGELTDFLYAFYSAPHLHQVRRLSIQPLAKEDQLDLQFSVEALVLDGGFHEKGLSQSRLQRLSLAEAEEYRQAIVERNLFAAYEPPPPPPPPPQPKKVETRPPPPPPKPRFDPAKFAVISAIIEVAGQPQVWINDRTAGKILKFREGDSFSIGQLQGSVARIGTLDVVLEHSEGRRLLTLGESLHEGVDLPEE